ncbi:MAG: histidinol dehydrogenase [Enterococcus sp.]
MKIRSTATETLAELCQRNAVDTKDVSASVSEIIETVKTTGDQALIDYTEKFDGQKITTLKITTAEIEAAIEQVDAKIIAVMRKAKKNIRKFHEKQVRQGFVTAENGTVMGQRVLPLERVGVYVPGGTAAYPSTVLMDVIPAQVAGVKEIVMVTPPDKNGQVNPVILAAAQVAGVTEIYRVGGAQAVAALAYGTQSIPQVDKIVGPGNIFVATAKKLVYGAVDIDMIAGPSDILIVADETAKAKWVAADLLAQAEHDVNAQAVLVTTSQELAQAVQAELTLQTDKLARKEIASVSILNNGKIILVASMEEALELSNKIAPEHLELSVAEPFALLDQVKNAGSVFLGHYTPEVLGDYFAGPNHTLPTEGTSRFYSALSVDDFVKRSSYLYYTPPATQKVAEDVIYFANAEGLGGHANSMAVRFEEE